MHPYIHNAVRFTHNAGIELLKIIDRLDILQGYPNTDSSELENHIYEMIADPIRKYYPGQSISLFSTESVNAALSNDKIHWFIEPLSSPQNFLRGQEDFVVSLGIFEKKSCIISVIYKPLTDSLISCLKGSHAQINGKRIRIPKNIPKNLLIGISASFSASSARDSIIKNISLNKPHELRISGCPAVDIIKVSLGHIDGCCRVQAIGDSFNEAALFILKESGGFYKITKSKCEKFNIFSAARDEKILCELTT